MELYEDFKYTINEEDNLTSKTIALIVGMLVIVVSMVYIIRIYSNEKDKILYSLHNETSIIETLLEERFGYSRDLLYILSNTIIYRKKDESLESLKYDLEERFRLKDVSNILGWHKYSLIDKNYNEILSINKGNIEIPTKKTFLKELLNSASNSPGHWKDSFVFHSSQNKNNKPSLKLINFIHDEKTMAFKAAIILSFDLSNLIKLINKKKKFLKSNYIILDDKLNKIASSQKEIDHITDPQGDFTNITNKVLNEFKQRPNRHNRHDYLDVISGINYCISPLDELPFNIIVNIDNKIIRKNIFSILRHKAIEVSLITSVVLILLYIIYQREKHLRSKALHASIKAEEASAIKTNFLSFTAHEIRSPLGFILTGSEMILKEMFGPISEAYKQYISGIHQNSKLILDFITDILEENQIIEGKFKVLNTIVSLDEMINEAYAQVSSKYPNAKINFSINISNDIPFIVCDKRRIVQVFANLMKNSVQYSKQDIFIKVSAKLTSDGLVIDISDKGAGMTEESVLKAMCRYGSQPVHSNKVESYGLGLPIVKLLLEAHNATMKIITAIDKGTTIRLIFPKYKLVYRTQKNNDN